MFVIPTFHFSNFLSLAIFLLFCTLVPCFFYAFFQFCTVPSHNSLKQAFNVFGFYDICLIYFCSAKKWRVLLLESLEPSKNKSTYTNIRVSLFGFDHTLTLPNCGASCFTFSIAKKPSTKYCARWSFHNLWTNNAKVIEFWKIFSFEN
jgi:hypothetical protein